MSSTRLLSLRALTRSARPSLQTRTYTAKQQPSASTQFYKQFTRLIAKVLLMSVFTYQLAYWTWAKLETDEVRAERNATIAGLEAQVNEYEKSKSTAKDVAKKSL